MPIRKIQKVGGSTYIVSLPKSWVIRNKLKEKELVSVKVRDKTVIISPYRIEIPFSESIELNLDECKDFLIQILYTLYYLGVNEIRLVSENNVPIDIINKLEDFITSLNGAELVYEDSKKILISFFVSVKRITSYQLFMRFLIIIKRMIQQFLENSNNKIKIKELEQDIDRIYHLFNRWFFEVSRGNINEDDVLIDLLPFYLRIALRLEKFSDLLQSVISTADSLKDEELNIFKETLSFLILRIDQYLEFLSERVFDKKDTKLDFEVYNNLKMKIEGMNNKIFAILLLQLLGLSESNEKDIVSIFKLKDFILKRIENKK